LQGEQESKEEILKELKLEEAFHNETFLKLRSEKESNYKLLEQLKHEKASKDKLLEQLKHEKASKDMFQLLLTVLALTFICTLGTSVYYCDEYTKKYVRCLDLESQMLRTQEGLRDEKDKIVSRCSEMCKNNKGKVKQGFQNIFDFLSVYKIKEKEAS